jgi:gas vesicle structural protein
MPRRPAVARVHESVADRVLEPPEASLLDLLDRLLEKGVMANGDVTLGVAGVDLIYLRLATVLCAADRIFGNDPAAPKRKSRHRRRGPRRAR